MRFLKCFLISICLILGFYLQPAWAEGKAYLVEVDGAIGPVTQDLITRAIDDAELESATLLVLLINTPGGLDHSMRKIISAILDSDKLLYFPHKAC